jgi:hypothetical protein
MEGDMTDTQRTGTRTRTLLLLATLAVPALADAQATAPPALDGPTRTPSGSYLNLAPHLKTPARPLVQAPRGPVRRVAATAPRVVCGMTIIPGDPAVDPGIMARATPSSARPSMRAVEPMICRDRSAR